MSLDVTTLALAKSYTNQHGGGGGSALADDDILDSLIVTDMLSAIKDADGKILTDETNKILLM